MDGLVFSRQEFLVLMNAAGANNLVGINSDSIVPNEQKQHAQFVRQGIKQLQDRGLMEIVDDVHVLPSDLLAMAAAVAHPQLVTQIVRTEPDGGQRLGLMYQSHNVIVEFTMPQEMQFRLAGLASTRDALQRIRFLTGVTDTPATAVQFALEQNDFMTIKQVAESGQKESAVNQLIAHGIAKDNALAFVDAIRTSQISSTITWLLIDKKQQVIDGRDMAVLQSAAAIWIMYQTVAGQPELTVSTVSFAEFPSYLLAQQTSFAA